MRHVESLVGELEYGGHGGAVVDARRGRWRLAAAGKLSAGPARSLEIRAALARIVGSEASTLSPPRGNKYSLKTLSAKGTSALVHGRQYEPIADGPGVNGTC